MDPKELLSFSFVKENSEGRLEKATVQDLKTDGKFIIKFVNGGEEIITYNNLILHYNKDKEENVELYAFKKSLDHCKLRNGYYELQIE